MKFANFETSDNEMYSFEVSDNFDTSSNSFDRMLDNFLLDNEGGKFISITDEPLGYDMSDGI